MHRRTAMLAKRLARLEARTGNGRPHVHPLKLLMLGRAGEPDDAWLAEQAACDGRDCAHPEFGRLAIWGEDLI